MSNSYKLKDGTKVPGVTKVIGLLDKPFLVPWANKLGLSGINSTEYVAAAARKGKLIHSILESHTMKVGVDLDGYKEEEINEAVTHLEFYKEWAKDHIIEPVFAEKDFISEEHKYCGIIDFFALVDGKFTVIDFKTSKAIGKDQLMQLSAYVPLLKENGYQVDQVMVINVGKNPEDKFMYEIMQVEETADYFKLFKALLNVYWTQKEIGWE